MVSRGRDQWLSVTFNKEIPKYKTGNSRVGLISSFLFMVLIGMKYLYIRSSYVGFPIKTTKSLVGSEFFFKSIILFVYI